MVQRPMGRAIKLEAEIRDSQINKFPASFPRSRSEARGLRRESITKI
jgi:hypothetical protein